MYQLQVLKVWEYILLLELICRIALTQLSPVNLLETTIDYVVKLDNETYIFQERLLQSQNNIHLKYIYLDIFNLNILQEKFTNHISNRTYFSKRFDQ